jgi:hypothetical protein
VTNLALVAGALPDPGITLHGLDDRVCAALEARSFADAIPGARFVALPANGPSYDTSAYGWGAFIDAYRRLAAAKEPVA